MAVKFKKISIVYLTSYLIAGVALWLMIESCSVLSAPGTIPRGEVHITAITVGILIFIISELGIYGAAKRKKILLLVFIGLLTLLWVLSFAVFLHMLLSSFRPPGDVHSELSQVLYLAQREQLQDPGALGRMDEVQMAYNCCGIMGYQDWRMQRHTCGVKVGCVFKIYKMEQRALQKDLMVSALLMVLTLVGAASTCVAIADM